jgi:head-tail adaptor
MKRARGGGNLTERVLFQEPVALADGIGGQETGWSAGFECRAGYTRLRGGETVIAGRLSGKQPTVIRVRANSQTRGVNEDWRVVDQRTQEVFNIRSIIETEDRLYLDFACESGVAV